MEEKKIEISLPLNQESYTLLKQYVNKKNVEIDKDIMWAFIDYEEKITHGIDPEETKEFTSNQLFQIPRSVFMMIETLILLDTSHNPTTLAKRKEFAINCFTELAHVESYKRYHILCESGITDYLTNYRNQQREPLKKYIDAVHLPTKTLDALKQNTPLKLKLTKLSSGEK